MPQILLVDDDQRIIDLTVSGIEFLSPVALPKDFHFKIHSDLFVQIGIKPPSLSVQTCLPFKHSDEAFHVRARFFALKESEVELLRAWITARIDAPESVDDFETNRSAAPASKVRKAAS